MIAFIICFLAIVITYLLRFYRGLKHVNKHLKCFPCPPDKFLLGHALDFDSITTIIQSCLKYQQEYGGAIRLNVGFCYPFVLITDIKLLEFLLTSTKIIEKSQDYKFLHKWLGTGLLTSYAPKWMQTRKIITPAFHFQILEQFIDVFNSATDVLIDKLSLKVGEEIDVFPYLTAFTLDVICETSMGTTINAQMNEESPYVKSVKEMGRIAAQRGFEPLKQNEFIYFFSRDYWKEKKAVKIIHDYTNSVIQKRKNDLGNKSVAEVDDAFGRKKRLAFLDLLLQSKLNGKPMEDDDIRQEVNTIMFAGHDTTSTALSFLLFCLSCNKDAQDNIVEELRTIFSDDNFRPVTYRDLQEMKYLEMAIKESLRLYPPAAMFAREVMQDEEFYGGILPPGVPLVMFPFGLHRDPNVFPDPEKYDPERFTTENQAKRNPFSYIPFSAGPRNCIGQRFAMLEMKATTAKLLRRFEVHPVPEHKIQLSFETVLKSHNGVYVKLTKRDF